MSVKAGNRVIRDTFDQTVKEAYASGALCSSCLSKDAIIDQRDRRIVALENTLARTQADLHRATDALTAIEADLAQERRTHECTRGLLIATHRSLDAAEENRRVLSQIIRLGMTPARYHELRVQVLEEQS